MRWSPWRRNASRVAFEASTPDLPLMPRSPSRPQCRATRRTTDSERWMLRLSQTISHRVLADRRSSSSVGLIGWAITSSVNNWRLSVTVRLSRRKDADKRQEQLQRRAAEADEAMVAVKGLGLLVFGIDGDRKDRKFGSH